MSQTPSQLRPALIWVALLSLGGCQPLHAERALPSNTTRWVLSPSAIASLSSAHDAQGVPERICFGDPFGPSALYLKFPSGWNARGRAVKAFLTLTPSDAAASDASTISVTAWRVRSDWQPGELRTWSDKPELAPPFASRAITSAPPRELRIDVTELARFAAENPERDFGIALVSRGGAGRGAPFATGMAGGVAPRLEVYVH